MIENGNIDGLVQDCSNSISNALELLQFCTKPSILCFFISLKVNLTILQSSFHIDVDYQPELAKWEYQESDDLHVDLWTIWDRKSCCPMQYLVAQGNQA